MHEFLPQARQGLLDAVITVMAVAHLSREPGYWRGR